MENELLLRNALKVNGAFSILSAVAALLLGGTILAVNEMAGGNGLVFGMQLLVFAAFVLFNAFKGRLSKVMVIIIIVLDGLYVLQVVAAISQKWSIYSEGGLTLNAFAAICVSAFAFYQVKGYKLAFKKSG